MNDNEGTIPQQIAHLEAMAGTMREDLEEARAGLLAKPGESSRCRRTPLGQALRGGARECGQSITIGHGNSVIRLAAVRRAIVRRLIAAIITVLAVIPFILIVLVRLAAGIFRRILWFFVNRWINYFISGISKMRDHFSVPIITVRR